LNQFNQIFAILMHSCVSIPSSPSCLLIKVQGPAYDEENTPLPQPTNNPSTKTP
jgi:hypothetical protein